MLRLGRHTLPMLFAIAASASSLAQPRGSAQTPSTGELPATDTPGTLPRPPVVEPRLTLWLGHTESDNIARTARNTDGSYDSLGLLVGLGHTSPRVEARLQGDLEYRTYSVDGVEVEDETIGNLDGSTNIGIVPGLFSWTFRGNRSGAARDPFAPIGPFNRGSILTLGSGPLFDLPLGSRTSFSIGSEYSTRRFNDAINVDSDAVLYRLGVFRQTSRSARFGISLASSDTDYPNVDAPSYQIDTSSVRYEKSLATGRVIAAIGRSELEIDNARSDEPLLEFEWTRDLATRSSLSVRAARGFTDAGNLLAITAAPAATENVMDVVISASPVERKSAEITYQLNGTRTRSEITLGSFEDAFLTTPAFDNESTYTRVALNRIVSSRLGVNIAWTRVLRAETAPLSELPRNEDSVLSAWINRALGRRYSLAFVVTRYERGGQDTFGERRYELRLGYNPARGGSNDVGLVGR
jgi:hypothetical protein